MLARPLAFSALALLLASGALAQPSIPRAPTRWVTDEVGLLSPAARQSLDQRLAAYERATGRQAIVYVGRDLGGAPIEDFAVRAFEAWGVGREGRDDGVALFVFPKERRARIEVGYGLEGELPDITAGQILDRELIPRLARGDADAAVTATMNAVMQTLGGPVPAGGPPVAPGPAPARQPSLGEMIVFGLFALGFLILLIKNPGLALFLLANMMSRHGGGGGGGGGFGGGGGRSGGGGASRSW